MAEISDNDDVKSSAETIRRLREARGLTQAELADKVGVHPQSVSRWESEGSISQRPRGRILRKLAEVLGVTVSDIVGSPRISASGLSPDERVLVAQFRSMTTIQRGKMLGFAEGLTASGSPAAAAAAAEFVADVLRQKERDGEGQE